jgi:single-stranded-DNA-specific exonuclease
VRLADPPRRIGTNGQHLSLRFVQHGVTLRAVAFGGGEWEQELVAVEGPLSVAFQPVINHFRGRQTVEMHLSDWRPDTGNRSSDAAFVV